MPRGAPDYSNVRAPGNLDRLDDLAELPPRLGFPSGLDRLGKVVLLEDFDTGGNLVSALTADLGETSAISNEYNRYGRFSWELARVADADSYAGAYVRVAAIGEDRIGGEVQFVVREHYPNLKLYLSWHDGTNGYTWGLRWDTANEKAYLGSDSVGYTQITGTYKCFLNPALVHTMKIVGDIDDEAYIRAYIDGKKLTLPEADPYKYAYTYTPDIALSFYNGLDPTTAAKVFVDTMIITRAEP